ncbi:glycerol-3-phosphate dehydrogenase [Variovorax ginsengisoli]|uniref:Glycerol-3-phosphate dehydrogenase n=1 Tax=Variovorax ginsengisoli TaxID=363844 RepID=A0ABT8S272_9BURK|nr:glycerol-3-phosphate dehydrogenase [Variovorax ginsengisoli]MDN8613758.1 glycerol-3-phosphate dehydrogenase [Variovorax ginsengisoli]MDO1532928.1 glycerol-3-phosphate dehydrogenase [Variovorax ginsengisoli]
MKRFESEKPLDREPSHIGSEPIAVSAIASPQQPSATDFDVLIVGGGINGCGIARDLAGRGWRVLLCEKDDLAAHTSSSSTKLIHGGLRYLEYYEFSLVRKALQEREVLLKSAPHIMWPLRFVMPHDPSMRPAWMIRIGLFLYDHLARREVLPGSRTVDLRRHEAGAALKPAFKRGFVYSDGWVDDARLVVLNALDARARGAEVLTRTRCASAQRSADGWTAVLEGPEGRRTVRARAVVNAAGPWAEAFLRGVAHSAQGEALATRHLRLVKGSHIVVPRVFGHDHAYIFQNPDKRIIFAIPYQDDFTLIGTTDIELQGDDPGAARIGADEIDYLCEQASRYFAQPVKPSDVVWTYSGVRPLLDDASGDPAAVTRDYMLESNTAAAPLLSVWGGKITTFRKLAEDAADEVGRMLGETRSAWTDGAFMAGGDLADWIGATTRSTRPDDDFERFVAAVQVRHPWLEPALAHRLARAYGARISEVLGDAASMAELGPAVAPGLHERELHYLQDQEWACSGDDVLWRRSKLGLRFTPQQRDQVGAWMQRHARSKEGAPCS